MAWQHSVDVLVTFDFDAETLSKQRAHERWHGPAFESHGTYGPKVGIWRILDALDQRSIPGTFFVPGWVAEHWPDVIGELPRRGHEVGLHGYLHEYPTAMVDRAEEEMVLERGIEALSAVTGQKPAGFRPPGFLYSSHTVELLRANEFTYGSSMQDDDAAYLSPGSPPFVEIPCLWHLCDDLFGWHADVKLPPSAVEEHWVTELEEIGRYPGRIYVLTMHPQLVGHPGRLAMVERVLDRAVALGANFKRCVDVANELLRIASEASEGNASKAQPVGSEK